MASNVSSARTVMERCDTLALFSEEVGRLTRRFATPALQQARTTVASWMSDAGMTVHYDAIGNLIGRYAATTDGAPALLLGSHLDTVRDAGKYDGPLGVMIALACVERLHRRQERLPFAIEVIGFADEEGVRYNIAYLGSKAATGTLDPDLLSETDADGISLASAIRAFGGQPDPVLLRTPRWQRDQLIGYCEVHIEQGPVLEASGLPVAVVSSIAGQSRIILEIRGEAGHAGTAPMHLRRDALCAAAEFIVAVEAWARSQPGLVATVGRLMVQPGVANVIPGAVSLSLDVRHPDDEVREHAANYLYTRAEQLCQQRQVALNWQLVQEHRSVTCTPRLARLLEQAISREGLTAHVLASGAGHDAVVMSAYTDMAMLFVRCRGGISHHPAESVSEADVAVAIKVLERFVLSLCREEER